MVLEFHLESPSSSIQGKKKRGKRWVFSALGSEIAEIGE